MALASSEDLRVLDSIDELTSLAADWAALAARCPGYYLSQTFQWADAAWRIVAQPAGRSLRCLALRTDGRLVAIWPLVVRREGRLNIVQPLGYEGSEYSAPLVEPGPEMPAQIERLLQAAGRLGDTLLLIHVRSDSALAAVLGSRRQLGAAYDAQSLPSSGSAGDCSPTGRLRRRARAGDLDTPCVELKHLAENGRLEIGAAAHRRPLVLIDWAIKQTGLPRRADAGSGGRTIAISWSR